MGLAIFDESQPTNFPVEINVGSGTTVVQAIAATQVIQRVDTMPAVSFDTVDHKVTVWLGIASTWYALGTVDLPAGAGFGTVPRVDLIATLYPATIGGIVMQAFTQLGISVDVAVTSGTLVTAVAMGGTF